MTNWIKIVSGNVVYPYRLSQLCSDNPEVSFPREPTAELLAEYGVHIVAETPPPKEDGKRAVPATPVRAEGGWVQGWVLEDLPRRMVRKSTITARLIAAGKMEAAFTALMAHPVSFARWIASDRPSIYFDDPDALALLVAIQADATSIMDEDDA